MSRVTTPAPYIVGTPPSLPGGDAVYLAAQLQAIATSIAGLRLMSPQAAAEVPKTLNDGMQRLARAPWWPVVGQTADAWVYYDLPTGTWLYL